MAEGWIRVLEEFLKHKGRIFGTIFGVILGYLVLRYGWLKAFYFFLCVVIGFYLGKRIDSEESLLESIKKILPSQQGR